MDEPEANLNPELYPLVAGVLLKLQENGVQIFVATHSYNFAKYLEIRRKNREQVMFHNLYKGTSELPDSLKDMSEKMKKQVKRKFTVILHTEWRIWKPITS